MSCAFFVTNPSINFLNLFQNLAWSFGANKNVPVLNLSDDNRKVGSFDSLFGYLMYPTA